MATRIDWLALPGRVVAYFIRHPEEGLSTEEIAQRFGARPEHVTQQLRHWVNNGVLSRPFRGGGHDSFGVYAAGPKLLTDLIGVQPQAQACVPAERR